MNVNGFIQRYKLHHLLLWALLFFGWHFFRYQDYPAGRGWWITFVKVADLAILIYITNYLLIPKLFYKKHYAWFALAFVAMILLSSVIKVTIIGEILNITGNLKTRIYDNVIPHFFLVIAGIPYSVFIQVLDHLQDIFSGRQSFLCQLDFAMILDHKGIFYLVTFLDKQNILLC